MRDVDRSWGLLVQDHSRLFYSGITDPLENLQKTGGEKQKEEGKQGGGKQWGLQERGGPCDLENPSSICRQLFPLKQSPEGLHDQSSTPLPNV